MNGSNVVDLVKWLKIMANRKTLVYQGRRSVALMRELQ